MWSRWLGRVGAFFQSQACTQWIPCTNTVQFSHRLAEVIICTSTYCSHLAAFNRMYALAARNVFPAWLLPRASHHNIASHESRGRDHPLRACPSTGNTHRKQDRQCTPQCVCVFAAPTLHVLCVCHTHPCLCGPPSVVLWVWDVKDPTELASLWLLVRLRQIQPRKVELHLFSLL